MNCKICGKDDDNRPMAFRGTEWCSETHRKQLAGEAQPVTNENSVVE